MRTTLKFLGAAALAGTMALATASPSQARWHGHGNWGGAAAGAAIGFAAGAAIGAAAANNGGYYSDGPYAYDNGYADDGGYVGGPAYVAPVPSRCWRSTDDSRGYGYYTSCQY